MAHLLCDVQRFIYQMQACIYLGQWFIFIIGSLWYYVCKLLVMYDIVIISCCLFYFTPHLCLVDVTCYLFIICFSWSYSCVSFYMSISLVLVMNFFYISNSFVWYQIYVPITLCDSYVWHNWPALLYVNLSSTCDEIFCVSSSFVWYRICVLFTLCVIYVWHNWPYPAAI